MKKLISLVLILVVFLFFCLTIGGDKDATNKLGCLSFLNTSQEEMTENVQQWAQAAKEAEAADSSILYFEDLSTMLLALEKGEIRAITCPECVARYVRTLDPEQFISANHALKGGLAMALPEENTALLEKLNSAISSLKADGTLAALQKEYIDNCDAANMPQPEQIPSIEGADTLRVVITGDMPPLDYMTADGQAAGYNIALLSAISKELNMNIELVAASAGSRALMLSSGKADVVFWSRGSEMEFDLANDMPQGIAVTEPYLEYNIATLRLK